MKGDPHRAHKPKQCKWQDEGRDARGHFARCKTKVPNSTVEFRGVAVCDAHWPAYEARKEELRHQREAVVADRRARLDPGCQVVV